MHYNRTFLIGAVVKTATAGNPVQSGDTPINFNVVCESINPQNGQIGRQYFSVAYWQRQGQRLPFDIAQLVEGQTVIVEGRTYPETYQKNDGTTGVVMKMNATTIGIPHGITPQQQQPATPATPQTPMAAPAAAAPNPQAYGLPAGTHIQQGHYWNGTQWIPLPAQAATPPPPPAAAAPPAAPAPQQGFGPPVDDLPF
jgi:single-stranded DNA-binding protein